jgi:glycosyltransferase involved in cell wall biosynthesis
MTGALNMADSPVSVIMNCLNGSKYLKEAIDSVYAQTYKYWEIIFWDNASTDNSAEIAKSYDSKLRYFRGDKTVPLYAARNLALQQVRSKYITFLDCDDMWLPQKLERQVKVLENVKNIGLAYSNVEILERDGIRRAKYNKIQPAGLIFRHLLKEYNINLATVMISSEVMNSLDRWFDNSLNVSGDADLFLRIGHDWNVYYLPEVTAIYREHDSSLTADKIDSLPMEQELILCKFSEIYENFWNDYKKEISDMRKRAQLSVILFKWKAKRNADARKIALKNITSSYIFTILYFLSFFPFSIVYKVRTRIKSLLKG